jgi:hypothetical protein
MFDGLRNNMLARGAGHVPGLKRLPILKLLALGEIAVLAHKHYQRLTPTERERLVALLKTSRGRTGNLSARERDELEKLVAKMEPRILAGDAVNKLSPVPLPRRFTHGPKRSAA